MFGLYRWQPRVYGDDTSMKLKIVEAGDPVLRGVAQPLSADDVNAMQEGTSLRLLYLTTMHAGVA
jgi:hypothetical protein